MHSFCAIRYVTLFLLHLGRLAHSFSPDAVNKRIKVPYCSRLSPLGPNVMEPGKNGLTDVRAGTLENAVLQCRHFIHWPTAAKGQEVGVPAPTHAALTAVVKRVELGEVEPSPDNVVGI